jgi:acyl-CoA thioester hydrolase
MIKETNKIKALTDTSSYDCWTEVSLRFGDTDAVGHINNAVFSTLLEQGRCTACFDGVSPLSEPGTMFVLASIKLDFLAEMHFPGTARVGTKIISFGRTSLKLGQAIFLNGTCCATSEDTMVLIDQNTRRPIPISDETRRKIESRFHGSL